MNAVKLAPLDQRPLNRTHRHCIIASPTGQDHKFVLNFNTNQLLLLGCYKGIKKPAREHSGRFFY